MSKIMQMIFGICAALVFIGAVQIICPQKSMKKSINFILGVVFVLSLITPAFALKGVSLDFKLPEVASESTGELSSYTAEYLVRAVLDSAEIKYENLSVTTDILEDKRISITKVTLVSAHPKEQIVDALKEIVEKDRVEVLNE